MAAAPGMALAIMATLTAWLPCVLHLQKLLRTVASAFVLRKAKRVQAVGSAPIVPCMLFALLSRLSASSRVCKRCCQRY
jgi:hypothetical protein